MPEFDLALNTGLRRSEQYGMLWENVSLPLRLLTIPRSKNGAMRHVPLNQAAIRALGNLRAEIERDMKLMGCRTVDQLSRDNLRFR